MEIAISALFLIAALFVSTRVHGDLGRLGFIAALLAWTCFSLSLYPDAVVRATLAAGPSGATSMDAFSQGVVRLYQNLHKPGVALALCVLALATLAIVPRPNRDRTVSSP
ncbi:hypothetical protein [Lysobacter enzymogenes]|uniref:Uncharacterized protein n=1 Tax=Lysobacter enzymogenes TaxID=69 RepID=A0A3N2RM51_LYSEN|nr:hypothetical protein [Lysobacter enzymogenes]ROU08426.1 hypothetical protein D9T17_03820 [Lysobacter enzymogenes]